MNDLSKMLIARGQKENGEWEQGYYVCIGENHYILTGQIDSASGYPRFFYSKVKPETICRFTGLYDKNKTEIFERDVIQSNELEHKGIIEFDKYCRYMIREIPTNAYYLLAHINDEIEIIGNEFDNPEFLKE